MGVDMMLLFNLYVFILGSLIGSFLNVCIYRLPHKQSVVHPRSRCGSCQRTLSALDLIPIFSWLFLKGKCRTCHASIAIRYPLVEALTGGLFLWVFSVFGTSIITPVLWFFTAYLLVVALIDLDHMIIPNRLVGFGLVASLILPIIDLFFTYPFYVQWTDYILGILIPTGLMFVVAMASYVFAKSAGLGMGDVKIYAPIGAFLGWRLALLSIWAAFFLGGIFGLLWLFIFKKDRKAMIPFGPFICIGAFLASIYGLQIVAYLF